MNDEFWDQDMTTKHDKRGWFGRLSIQRKIIFILILLFVIGWGFFIGMQVARAMGPAADDWHIVTSADLGDKQLIGEALDIEGIRTILLVGCDEREGYEVGRSDTMMLAFINGDTEEISLLSIPRDCYVQIPGYSTKTKINHSYSYGGVNLTSSTIEYFLGVNIDDYVEVDFNGFVEVVDALGGVYLHVDQRMINYDEGINLNAGYQTLSGEQALGYCRFRVGQHGTASISDIKRAEHQQNFIVALKNKLLSLSTVWKIPQLVTLANKNVSTSMRTTDAIKLGNTLLNMELDNIKTYTIPTHSMWIDAVSYEIVDRAGTIAILDEIIGDEQDYEPHIIDDGGAGRHNLDEDVEPVPEDVLPEIGEPLEGDGSGEEGEGGEGDTPPADESGEGGEGEDTPTVPVTGPNSAGDPTQIPEPGQ